MKDDTGVFDDEVSADGDALAVLFVAGELDEARLRAFDARLAGDAALREQVGSLGALDAMLRADAAGRAVSPADSRKALARSLRLVRDQSTAIAERPSMHIHSARGLNLPRWAWGTAVAALVAVGFVVWVTNSDPEPIGLIATKTQPLGWAQGPDFAPAFDTIDLPAADDQANAREITSQVDALNMLAAMSEPDLGDGGSGDSDGDGAVER